MMSEVREHLVTDDEADRRLDSVLALLWPDLSRARIQRLIREGRVTVNDRRIRPSDTAKSGQLVVVEVPEPEPTDILGEDIPLDIVYEDPDLLVVNKPAGLVVHPGAGNPSGTLVNALVHHLPGVAAVGGVGRPGIIHRLDKGTSGLLLVAKNDRAHQKLTRALSQREIRRTYLALVWGTPDPAEGRIEAPLGRHRTQRKKIAVVKTGRVAATRYRILEPFVGCSLIECSLETGRTHQIRVHLSHLGHPVMGDQEYGGGPRRALNLPQGLRRLAVQATGIMRRPALHAVELAFSHPITGRPVDLKAPLPEDFAIALEIMRRSSQAGPVVPPWGQGAGNSI
jgi:23S rRNA pseudouridine1911/1915/1917 synthase